MPPTVKHSNTPQETEALGAALAARLTPGDVVLVAGELGAGKTTFVRGACRALGVTGPVTSPTYTVGNRYRGRVLVSHLDLYRFQGFSAAEWGDLEPYFDDAVAFVEWPEAAAASLPAPRLSVSLHHSSPERRRVSLAAARGLALALDLPLAGVSTLEALAAGAPGAIPVVDARRREVFALIDGELRCLAPERLPPGTLVGDGALCYRTRLEAAGAEIPRDDDARHLPRARFHAALARDFGLPDAVEPIYVRVPDAEKALAR